MKIEQYDQRYGYYTVLGDIAEKREKKIRHSYTFKKLSSDVHYILGKVVAVALFFFFLQAVVLAQGQKVSKDNRCTAPFLKNCVVISASDYTVVGPPSESVASCLLGLKCQQQDGSFYRTREVVQRGDDDCFTWMKDCNTASKDDIEEIEPEDFKDTQEALNYYTKQLELHKEVHGEDHPLTAQLYNNIGVSWDSLGNPQEALKNHRKALAIREKFYGENHPFMAQSYNNIGVNLESLGNSQDAVEYHRMALKIREDVYGDQHPLVAQSHNNLGASLEGLELFEEALEHYETALEIRREVYGEEHVLVASSHNNVAVGLGSLNRFDDAVDHYERALQIWGMGEEEGLEMALAHSNLGMSLTNLQRFEEALEHYKKALEIRKNNYGEEHLIVAMTYNDIGISLGNLGRSVDALTHLKKSIELLCKLEREPFLQLKGVIQGLYGLLKIYPRLWKSNEIGFIKRQLGSYLRNDHEIRRDFNRMERLALTPTGASAG